MMLAGLALAAASLTPETPASLALGWLVAALLVVALPRSRRPLVDCFLMGITFHLIAFSWLTHTIVYFGGFPTAAGIALFVLFSVVSSLQFVFCGWLYSRLTHPVIDRYGVRVACAWFGSEFLVPRLFPWALAHSQVVWTELAGVASFVGVLPIGFLLVWWSDIAVGMIQPSSGRRRPLAATGAALVVLVLALGAGWIAKRETEHAVLTAPKVALGLVQGNVEAKQKRNVAYLEVNLERYRSLSREAVQQGARLIIWPESVLNSWTPEGLLSVAATKLDPIPDLDVPVLYGGLSFRKKPEDEIEQILREHRGRVSDAELESLIVQKFVAAIGVDRSRKLVGRYYKRVLMPFGEFMPFAGIFPFLKSISPMTGDFTAGDLEAPIRFEITDESGVPQDVRVAALICYEDLVPSMSRSAVLRGSTLLANLTNDAWFGDSPAPHQHHLLAQWRAIETRRALVRVTNTGVTAVVDPFGRTVARLPVFTAAYLVERVPLMTGRTVYSRIGDVPGWILAAGIMLAAIVRRKFI